MSVHRYSQPSFNAQNLVRQLPVGVTATVSGPLEYVDVDLSDDRAKDDLDELMASSGFSFVSTDPTDPAPIALAAPDGSRWMIQVDNAGALTTKT